MVGIVTGKISANIFFARAGSFSLEVYQQLILSRGQERRYYCVQDNKRTKCHLSKFIPEGFGVHSMNENRRKMFISKTNVSRWLSSCSAPSQQDNSLGWNGFITMVSGTLSSCSAEKVPVYYSIRTCNEYRKEGTTACRCIRRVKCKNKPLSPNSNFIVQYKLLTNRTPRCFIC